MNPWSAPAAGTIVWVGLLSAGRGSGVNVLVGFCFLSSAFTQLPWMMPVAASFWLAS